MHEHKFLWNLNIPIFLFVLFHSSIFSAGSNAALRALEAQKWVKEGKLNMNMFHEVQRANRIGSVQFSLGIRFTGYWI